MAFGKAMEMMGGHAKPKVGGAIKGEEKPAEKGDVGGEEGDDGGSGETTLKANGDGSYHSSGAGGEQDHPTLGHALTSIAHEHEPESKHMHISHDGLSLKSHGINEAGEHDGPHEHDDVEGVKDHVDSMMGNSEDGDDTEEQDEMPLGHGLHG
jgi:hypothetical protein